jgi:hypothetical protein
MNKITSFLLNMLLLSLLVGMFVLPATSMGITHVTPQKAHVLSEQDTRTTPTPSPKTNNVKKVTSPIIRKVTETSKSIETSQSTETTRSLRQQR